MNNIYRIFIDGDIDKLRALLDETPDINSIEMINLLYIACSFIGVNSIEMINLLLERGADVNDIGTSGAPPLYPLITSGLVQQAAILLKHGADVNFIDEDGSNYLHILLSILIMSPNNKDHYNKTLELVTLLLNFGIDIHHQDNLGNRPIDILDGYEYPKIRQLFDSYELQIKEPAC